MTFYTYMMKKYKGTEGPKSDLAWDMYDDREKFPRNGVGKYDGWYSIIHDYLSRQGACDDCMRTFHEAWAEYVDNDRRRRGKNGHHKPFIWEKLEEWQLEV